MKQEVKFIKAYKSSVAVNERGPYVILGYCSTRNAALDLGVGKGWYGSNGDASEIDVVIIDGNAYKIEEIDLDGTKSAVKEQLKKSALAKLSDAERRALGL